MKEIKKERDSNIELLRIICMVGIVCHHFACHGGFPSDAPVWNSRFVSLFGPLGKIFFVTFIAVSMWYLSDSKFKAERLIKVYGEALFYSVGMGVLTYFFHRPEISSIKNLISNVRYYSGCLFILTGNNHGFITNYICFYLFFPFLKMIADKCSKKQLLYLVICLFVIQVFGSFICGVIRYNQPNKSLLTLFVFVFYLINYLRKYPLKFTDNKIIMMIVFVIGYLCTRFSYKYKLDYFFGAESFIGTIVTGLAVFYFFKNIKIKNNKIINKISPCTLAVLLIHDNNYFRHYFWDSIVQVRNWAYKPLLYFTLLYFTTIICIFTFSFTIDFIRRLIEKEIMNKAFMIKLCKVLNELINNNDDKNSSDYKYA